MIAYAKIIFQFCKVLSILEVIAYMFTYVSAISCRQTDLTIAYIHTYLQNTHHKTLKSYLQRHE